MKAFSSSCVLRGLAVAIVLWNVASTSGQVVDPYYETYYAAHDLGAVPGVPISYGGITFKYDDPNTLLIGGGANGFNGAIYSIQVERGCAGNITGFVGKAQLFASAPLIDGGLAYGPNNVLFYSTYNNNTIGQILPGETAPAKIIDLTPLGVSPSTGTLMFVPPGFAGAGQLKIASYGASHWYRSNVVLDGQGTFDIVNVVDHGFINGGPEGIVYIGDVNPLFKTDSVLVSEYGFGRVSAFEIDANGDPIFESRRTFITGLSGAEGAAIDPLTGHFLFSTFGGFNRVVVVNGFVDPCPADIAPLAGDGTVNVNDLLAVINNWGQGCVPADINASGSVNVNDLLIVINEWGQCN